MTRLPVHQPRTCAQCDACCTVLNIEETQSPMFSTCRHVRAEGGCGIYATRPQPCRDANCSWLLGHYGLTGAHRPDRFGVVVWTGESLLGGGEPAIHVAESTPGAFSKPDVRLLIRELSTRGVPVLEIRRDGMTNVHREVKR